MDAHWTERSIEDYRFRIVADFISQIEEKMQSQNIKQDQLAKYLSKTKGRISQMLNNPGNITLDNIVKLARALEMKVSLVAYDDNDPGNKKGPINSDIFKICWEKSGKPQDFWELQESTQIRSFTTYPVTSIWHNPYPSNLPGTFAMCGAVNIYQTAKLDRSEIPNDITPMTYGNVQDFSVVVKMAPL